MATDEKDPGRTDPGNGQADQPPDAPRDRGPDRPGVLSRFLAAAENPDDGAPDFLSDDYSLASEGLTEERRRARSLPDSQAPRTEPDPAPHRTSAHPTGAIPTGVNPSGVNPSGGLDRSSTSFGSVDSAPKRYSGLVPQWRAPALLLLFTLLSAGQLWMMSWPAMRAFFPHHDYLVAVTQGTHPISVRIFILSFFLAFAAFARSSIAGRILFAIDLCVTFMMLCMLLDLSSVLIAVLFEVTFPLFALQVISGLTGFAVYSFKLLERGRMPARIKVEHRRSAQVMPLLLLAAVLASSFVVTAYVGNARLPTVGRLQDIALLGGIGPGVFLFLPMVFLQLYAVARLSTALRPATAYAPPVTVIIPAHNEAYVIGRTVAAMDAAAAAYAGPVHLLVLDNASTDETGPRAAAALAACAFATGELVHVAKPGKANALNAGLDATRTEFLVRVDADTQLGENNLVRALRLFSDPSVGVVGGLAVPPGGGLFDRARHLEVLVKHGLYSVALGPVHGVVGIPGMFAVYRTDLLRQLGGFVEGMNGEDTDVSLRIGELGLRAVVDPKIAYVSEVPAVYTHMREQRIRWFRSVYHVSSRCRDLIYSDLVTIRGKVMLPYMLLNSGRRAMMLPLAIFGLLQLSGLFVESETLRWQAVAAIALGAPTLVATGAALLNGAPRALLAIPEYLIFRLLRAYFTLESMLSITVTTRREDLTIPTMRNIVPEHSSRIA